MDTDAPAGDLLRSRALSCLSAWVPFAEGHRFTPPDRPDLGCFGTGYDSWGVQTNQKYAGACAVLAADPDLDAALCGAVRDELLDRALRALRFSLASHLTGSYRCTDGARWGGTWISALGVERMMHGVDAVCEHLSEADRDALRRVLTAEAEAQLGAEVVADPWASTGRNKPESNVWNGAVLARAALMWPDEPHADDWQDKATCFFVNGISVPADAADMTPVRGRPVGEWHVGANFLPHYALDHHGYLNVGYMVICLSNVAMLHFAFRARGRQPPAALYHHAADLWGLVKRLIFPSGRLIRVGGDTRQRYCYCQDYLVPALLWAADHLQDPHALRLAHEAVGLMQTEQQAGGDGSFLGRRLAHVARANPYYYTRLESDKAVVLSMAARWVQQFGIHSPEPTEPFEDAVAGGWEEPEHGAAFHRCPTRLVSWSWRAAERPQGLCLPPDAGHLAEWQENLAGSVRPLGVCGGRVVHGQRTCSFEGGFVTAGRTNEGAEANLPEGWRRSDLVEHRIAFAALPDGHTAVRLELASIGALRLYLGGVEGVALRVANDLFNGMKRTYYGQRGVHAADGPPPADECVEMGSPWLNVEDRIGLIGVYGARSWWLVRTARREGGYAGSIYSDRLCFPARLALHEALGPADLLDTGCLVLSSVDAASTERLWRDGIARRLDCGEGRARAVLVLGRDGEAYVLAANFSALDACVTAQGLEGAALVNLCTGSRFEVRDGAANLPLGADACQLYRIDGR